MPLPPVIKRRQQESIEIVGQMLFKIRATDRRLWHRFNKNASLEFSARQGSLGRGADLQRILHFTQQIVTDRAAHRVFSEFLVRMHVERAVEIICQLIFKFVAKHLVSFSEPSLTVGLLPLSAYCSQASTTRIRRRIFASSMRPRLILDLTVPSGIFSRSTISW